jgi:flavin reductase (DIM6/NTAB) family NADH-FMN oxidoreductase RutF
MQALTAPNLWHARDGAVPASTFRQALGRFGSGVTVVTVAHSTGYHAMTANAFMSISLDPPLVAISVARKARMHEHLQEGARIGISVLSESQETVAMHFGGKPAPNLVPQVVWEHETPLIAGSTATFVATIHRIHDGGDHRIFVAQLLQLQWHDAAPLLFWGGKFGEFMARQQAPGGVLASVPDFWC